MKDKLTHLAYICRAFASLTRETTCPSTGSAPGSIGGSPTARAFVFFNRDHRTSVINEIPMEITSG
jgi:hypothetical protein